MRRYIICRLLLMIPTLLGVAVIVFLLMRVVPGDIVEMRYAEGQFFNWIPPMMFTPFWENPWHNLAQMIWPALAVGIATRRSPPA